MFGRADALKVLTSLALGSMACLILAPVKSAEAPRIVVEEARVEGIPVRVHAPQPTRGRTLVIWLTGFSGSKTSVETQLRDLAAKGYVAMSFDPVEHGDRRIELQPELVSRVRGNIRRYFWPILAKSAQETTTLIDWAMERYGVLPEVGMGGVSMGGDISVAATGVEHRIKVVSACVATPDWMRPGSFEPPGAPDAYAQACYDAVNPLTNLRSYGHKPWIAFQSGAVDRQVPPDGGEKFVAALKRSYGSDAGRLVVNLQPNTPHAFTPEMWKQSLAWFGAHLPATAPAQRR